MNDNTLCLNSLSSDSDRKMKLNTLSTAFNYASLHCKLSPLVIMSILNHYQRRPSNRTRPSPQNQNQQKTKYPIFVVGLLFGRKDLDSNSILINDSFGLEIQIANNNGIAVNLPHAETTVHLHAESHPHDRLVGWYRTGLQIEPSSKSIHEEIIIKQLHKLSNKLSRMRAGAELDRSEYIHLLIDTSLTNNRLSIKAFTTESINDPLEQMKYENYLKEKKKRERLQKDHQNKMIQKDKAYKKKKKQQQKDKDKDKDDGGDESLANNKDQAKASRSSLDKFSDNLPELKIIHKPDPIFSRFIEISTSYLASEAVKIGIDMIIEGQPEGNDLDSPSMLMNDTNHLETILQSLLQNLEFTENYVNQVVNGNIVGDESLGWLIGEALCSVPNISPMKFEEMLSNRLQDLLMLVYLGKMTKAQIGIADKINKVLPITIPE